MNCVIFDLKMPGSAIRERNGTGKEGVKGKRKGEERYGERKREGKGGESMNSPHGEIQQESQRMSA